MSIVRTSILITFILCIELVINKSSFANNPYALFINSAGEEYKNLNNNPNNIPDNNQQVPSQYKSDKQIICEQQLKRKALLLKTANLDHNKNSNSLSMQDQTVANADPQELTEQQAKEQAEKRAGRLAEEKKQIQQCLDS